jgi:hypothetical protein
MKRNHLLTLAIFLFLISGPTLSGTAQTDSASASASAKFKNNNSRRFWMGSNYRKEWLALVKAPVINLSTEQGGLKPIKLGGGKQSKTLRMEDPTGRQYSLRLIEKFITSKTLPADLQSQAQKTWLLTVFPLLILTLLYQYPYYPRQPVFLIIK